MGKKKETQTDTPTNPQWATDAVQGVTGQVSNLSSLDPQSLIAGTNPLLDKALGSLMGNPYSEGYDLIKQGAAGGGSVGASRASDFYKDYENPYKNDVLNPVLADYDTDAARRTAQSSLDLAGSNAFGGSGASLTQSMLGGELARGRASTQGQLLSNMFSEAMGLAGQDADRSQSASVANAQLAESAAARKIQAGGQLAGLKSQEIGQQASFGDMLRQIEQQRLQAPVTLAQQQAGILGGLPLGNYTGRNSTKTVSDPMGGLGSALMTGAALFGAPLTGGLSLGGLAGMGGGLASIFGGGAATAGSLAAGGMGAFGKMFGGR